MKAPAAANRQIRNRSQKIASPTDILMSTAGVNITMTMRYAHLNVSVAKDEMASIMNDLLVVE